MNDERTRWSAFGLLAACLILVAPSWAQPSAAPESVAKLESFDFLAGDWECSGKFDSSGKTIAAHQHFARDVEGAWMLFRHDDKPPFSYHALAEWGWSPSSKRFVMMVQDSFGGARLFYSSGWESGKLQWDGDALEGAEPRQRFLFERSGDRHFNVSYFARKGEIWTRVDSSGCDKQ